MATTEHVSEKTVVVHHAENALDTRGGLIEGGFDLRQEDLPKGYYRSPFFIGTLIAASTSWAAVSFPILNVLPG
jgi:hypothetical protein